MDFINIKIDEKDSEQRLDRFLRAKFTHLKQGHIEQAIRKYLIIVNEKKSEPKYIIAAGDEVKIAEFLSKDNDEQSIKPKKTEVVKLHAKKIKFWHDRILFINDDIIIINKPINISVQGGTGITQSIDDILPIFQFDTEERPKLVHRLDKDTSGVMLLARNRKSAHELTKLFNEHKIEKIYHAVLAGEVSRKQGTITLAIADEAGSKKRAVTDYKVLDYLKGYVSLVEFKPRSGRKHQIRIHAISALNIPILGDFQYGGDQAHVEGFGNKIHLHAKRIIFEFKGQKIDISAAVPDHFLETYRLAEFKDK